MGRQDHEARAAGTPGAGKPYVRIRGVVVPSAWDARGRITQVAISGSDEQEYRVRKEGSGLDLGEMLHLCVEVTGRVLSDEAGGREILVEGFKKADLDP